MCHLSWVPSTISIVLTLARVCSAFVEIGYVSHAMYYYYYYFVYALAKVCVCETQVCV